MRKFLPLLLALPLLLTACKEKNEMDPGLYDSDRICLMVKGKMILPETDGTPQLSFNRSRREFRAGNDDMSRFFTVTCSELPVREGQEIQADLKWTSGSSVKSATGLTFKVEKTDGTGLVWLWCAADNTGAVVKILN